MTEPILGSNPELDAAGIDLSALARLTLDELRARSWGNDLAFVSDDPQDLDGDAWVNEAVILENDLLYCRIQLVGGHWACFHQYRYRWEREVKEQRTAWLYTRSPRATPGVRVRPILSFKFHADGALRVADGLLVEGMVTQELRRDREARGSVESEPPPVPVSTPPPQAGRRVTHREFQKPTVPRSPAFHDADASRLLTRFDRSLPDATVEIPSSARGPEEFGFAPFTPLLSWTDREADHRLSYGFEESQAYVFLREKEEVFRRWTVGAEGLRFSWVGPTGAEVAVHDFYGGDLRHRLIDVTGWTWVARALIVEWAWDLANHGDWSLRFWVIATDPQPPTAEPLAVGSLATLHQAETGVAHLDADGQELGLYALRPTAVREAFYGEFWVPQSTRTKG